MPGVNSPLKDLSLPANESEWLDSLQSLLAIFKDDEECRSRLKACEGALSKKQGELLSRVRFVLNYPGLADGDTLFFMSGLFKAGTTWLGKLLDAHPRLVCGAQEIHAFSAQVTDLYLGKPLSALPSSEARVWRENLLDARRCAMIWKIVSSASKASARRLGGRGPMADLRLLIAAFPRIRIPVIIRDGRDVAVSAAFFHGQYYDQSYERFFLDKDRKKLNPKYVEGWAWQFREYYKKAFEVAAEFPKNVKIVRYEDLLDRAVPVMQDVYRFLGVSDNLRIVEKCVRRCSFESLADGRRRGDVDNNSFFRKGVAGDWRNHFTEECVDAFKTIAGEFLIETSYESTRDWSLER